MAHRYANFKRGAQRCAGQACFDNVSGPPALTPPAAPSWIFAPVGDGQSVWNWALAANATGYNLKRATTNGGTYAVVAAHPCLTTFTNTALANGRAYYYVVAATNALNCRRGTASGHSRRG